MKKLFLLMLATVMLLTAAPTALSEEETAELPPDLFDVLLYDGESPTWIANALQFSNGILLAPAAVKDYPVSQLAVSDGVNAWEAEMAAEDESGRFTMICYNPDDRAPRCGSYVLLPQGESVPAASCTVRFGDAMGSRIIRGVLDSENIPWKGETCMLLTLSDEAPVGSPVLTADGLLAGIIISHWAEGPNRVLMLPAEGIARGITATAASLALSDRNPPEGLTVTVEKNKATLDWSAMAMPEKPEGSHVYIVIWDTMNSYLTWVDAENMAGFTMLLTPGRHYIAGVEVTDSAPDDIPESYVTFSAPQEGTLQEYDFKAVLTAVAEAPEGGLKEGEAPVPVTEVTEELLRSGRAYFYSHSTYSVPEEISGKTLLVSLTDPNGNNYRYESGWIYSPEYMAEDIWYVPLTDTSLTGSLDANGYPEGRYELAFYVDGAMAGSCEFVLEK